MNNNGSNNELSGNEIGFVDILKVIFKYKYFIASFTVLLSLIIICIYIFCNLDRINSYTIVYNIELKEMNYDQYKTLMNSLADKDNLAILLESIPQNIKEKTKLKNIKEKTKLTNYSSIFSIDNDPSSYFNFLYSKELIDKEKDLFKGYFNLNGEFVKGKYNKNYYLSSKCVAKNLNLTIEMINYVLYYYLKCLYNVNSFEDIINYHLNNIPSWKNILYANYLTQKEQLIKNRQVLLEIKRKYPSLNSLNANIINIQGDNSEYFIPTDVRLANIEIALSNIEIILENYYINKARYDFYNKIINELNQYSFKSFNEKTNENFFNHLKYVIENHDISLNQNYEKININDIDLQNIIDNDKENLLSNLTDFYMNTESDFLSKVHINIQEEENIHISQKAILSLFISLTIAIFLAFIINYIRSNINEIKNG